MVDNFLLQAETLVAGRGTFMSGIVSASIHAKKIYSFESCFSSWGRADIQVVDIRDQKQAYKN
jgi:hypothetical protein